MIHRSTVLILGAGASADYGFPSGYALLREVCNGGQELINSLWDIGIQPERTIALMQALRSSGRTSVDSFLEHRPNLLDVGKAAIAWALLPHEDRDLLLDLPEAGPRWYHYLFRRLNAPFDQIGTNTLTIVTYNYDRSLERYLLSAIASSYDKTEEAVSEQLSKIPIIHLHGKLGNLRIGTGEGRAYEPHRSAKDIQEAAAGIRVIHEAHAFESDPNFHLAHQAIANAEQVCFLGFGYDPTNIVRLGLEKLSNLPRIYGSSLGMEAGERYMACQALGVPANHQLFDHDGLDVLTYLRRTALLER